MIDERLELGCPFRQVLHFIQKDVRQVAKWREFVELHAENAAWIDAFGANQVLDDLLLQGGLPDLPRATQNDGWCEAGAELPEQDIEGPAAVRREHASRFPLPPRVRAAEVSVDLRRQPHPVKDVGLGHSIAASVAWLHEDNVTSALSTIPSAEVLRAATASSAVGSGRDRSSVYQTALSPDVDSRQQKYDP